MYMPLEHACGDYSNEFVSTGRWKLRTTRLPSCRSTRLLRLSAASLPIIGSWLISTRFVTNCALARELERRRILNPNRYAQTDVAMVERIIEIPLEEFVASGTTKLRVSFT